MPKTGDHLDINLSVGRISPISAADGSGWLGNRASEQNVSSQYSGVFEGAFERYCSGMSRKQNFDNFITKSKSAGKFDETIGSDNCFVKLSCGFEHRPLTYLTLFCFFSPYLLLSVFVGFGPFNLLSF